MDLQTQGYETRKPAEEARPSRYGELARKTISGLGWTVGTESVGQVSRFLISVVLARLLVPADFGMLGMVAVFTGFAGLFSDCGFSVALIQREVVEERHYSTVFWLTLIIGVVLCCVTLGAAPLIATFYEEPRLVGLVAWLALGFPVNSLSVVQKSILSRTMDFRLLGLIELANVLISGLAGITLAIAGFGVWSLVWQTLLSYVLVMIGTWWATDWRPRFKFDRSALSDLFGFSSNLLGFSVITYWFRNGDNLLVGRYFGSAILGIYARAYNLMLLPLSQITNVVSRVLFPALSRLQGEKARVKSVYLRSVALIALLTFPMMLGLLTIADHFVLGLYGPNWAAVIPVFRILCILGMTQSLSSTVGWIYQSQGRTDWMFRWGLFSGSLSIAGILIGIRIGTLAAVATCLASVGMTILPLAIAIPGKLIGMTFGDFTRSISGVLLCAAAMAASVWALGGILPPAWSHAAYLSVEIPFGVCVYALLIHIFQLSPYREFRALVLHQVDAILHSNFSGVAVSAPLP